MARVTEKQQLILEACRTPCYFTSKRDEDVARKLMWRGFLERVSGAVYWQRRYLLTDAGREVLSGRG